MEACLQYTKVEKERKKERERDSDRESEGAGMPKIAAFDGKLVEYVEVHDEPIHRRQFSNHYVYIYIAGIRQVRCLPACLPATVQPVN